MTRFGVPRAASARKRTACVFLPGMPSEGGEAILRGLTVIAGSPESSSSRAGVLFFEPGTRARLYGGLLAWANTVRSYIAGRHMRTSIVIGFDPHRMEALACSRPMVRIFQSEEDEILAVAALRAASVGLSPEERTLVSARNIRTVRELASTTHPELARGRARARALLEGASQLGLGFAEPAAALKRSA